MAARWRLASCWLCAWLLAGAGALGTPAARAGETLEIYFVDVGAAVGNATLLVAPSGESMMLDCGPQYSVQRVVDVLKQAGVTQVDYLVNTHYHADHYGATVPLAERIKVNFQSTHERRDPADRKTHRTWVGPRTGAVTSDPRVRRGRTSGRRLDTRPGRRDVAKAIGIHHPALPPRRNRPQG